MSRHRTPKSASAAAQPSTRPSMIVAIATPRVVCSVGLKNISRYFRLPSFTPSSSDSYAMRAKSPCGDHRRVHEPEDLEELVDRLVVVDAVDVGRSAARCRACGRGRRPSAVAACPRRGSAARPSAAGAGTRRSPSTTPSGGLMVVGSRRPSGERVDHLLDVGTQRIQHRARAAAPSRTRRPSRGTRRACPTR